MTEFERGRHLRKPLPSWWMQENGRDPAYPPSQGIGFSIERGGRTFAFVVPLSVLLRMGARKNSARRDLDRIWRERGDAFMAAAKRLLAARGFKARRATRLALADLPLDDDQS